MQFLKEQVAERKTALSGFPKESEERRKDTFSMLVSVNEAESEKLSDEEVVGNIFAVSFTGNGQSTQLKQSYRHGVWQRQSHMSSLRPSDGCLFIKISRMRLSCK
ncbi:hypothetical protein PTI98_007302 [Pleurotus ostreatus]|nr:hypothetical protein PTI98_007302 [Pleurotus ostreatus]